MAPGVHANVGLNAAMYAPNFYLIETGKEKTAMRDGTITVPNIDQAIRAIEANGGRLAAPKAHIPTKRRRPHSAGTKRVMGTVVQVSVSQGGIPKLAVPSAELTEVGITGDSWRYPFHGGRRRAILLVTAEGIDELAAHGYPLFAGALGENLTTRGIDRRDLRFGQRLRVGDAEVVLTEMRTPCATLDVYGSGVQAAMFDARVQAGDPESPRWGLSGFYASTVQTGTIRTGDPITLL